MSSGIKTYTLFLFLIVVGSVLKADNGETLLTRLWESPPLRFRIAEHVVFFDEGSEEIRLRSEQGVDIYHMDGSLKTQILLNKTIADGRSDVVRIENPLDWKEPVYSYDFNCFVFETLFKDKSTKHEMYLRDKKDGQFKMLWQIDSTEMKQHLLSPTPFEVSKNGAVVMRGRHPESRDKERLIILNEKGEYITAFDESKNGFFGFDNPIDRGGSLKIGIDNVNPFEIFEDAKFSSNGARVYVLGRASESFKKLRIIVINLDGEILFNEISPQEFFNHEYSKLIVSPDGSRMILGNILYEIGKKTSRVFNTEGNGKFLEGGKYLLCMSRDSRDVKGVQILDSDTLALKFSKHAKNEISLSINNSAFDPNAEVFATIAKTKSQLNSNPNSRSSHLKYKLQMYDIDGSALASSIILNLSDGAYVSELPYFRYEDRLAIIYSDESTGKRHSRILLFSLPKIQQGGDK